MFTEETPAEGALGDDLMIGARPIARFLGVAERRVYRIAEDKELPLFKFRGQIAGRKSKIREAILRLEASAEVS
jgi:hypothetical protein